VGMKSPAIVKMEQATIVGERVVLRTPSARDAAEFIALNRASTRFHRGLVSPPTKPAQFVDYLEKSRRADSAGFLICGTGVPPVISVRATPPSKHAQDARATHHIIGAINLSQIFRGGFQNAYLGYYVGAPYAGQGYMTEALRLMLRYAFAELKLHRLEANIQPQNHASIALVKRAGFSREGFSPRYLKIFGRWRDHERWAIIAEDWKTTRKSNK
jgi:ribosomal-protein-alanine N-acetyltransferase